LDELDLAGGKHHMDVIRSIKMGQPVQLLIDYSRIEVEQLDS
jgi:hypothetical protein